MDGKMHDPVGDLTRLLEPEYNPDFWSDRVRWEAADILRGLSAGDWQRLSKACREQPASWCMRLADACVLVDDPLAAGPAVELLKRAEAAAGSAAAAALIEMDYQWSPDEPLAAEVNRHLENASPAQAIPLRRLLARLPS